MRSDQGHGRQGSRRTEPGTTGQGQQQGEAHRARTEEKPQVHQSRTDLVQGQGDENGQVHGHRAAEDVGLGGEQGAGPVALEVSPDEGEKGVVDGRQGVEHDGCADGEQQQLLVAPGPQHVKGHRQQDHVGQVVLPLGQHIEERDLPNQPGPDGRDHDQQGVGRQPTTERGPYFEFSVELVGPGPDEQGEEQERRLGVQPPDWKEILGNQIHRRGGEGQQRQAHRRATQGLEHGDHAEEGDQAVLHRRERKGIGHGHAADGQNEHHDLAGRDDLNLRFATRFGPPAGGHLTRDLVQPSFPRIWQR
ncbi:MAG: hypothetical protein Q9Q13_06490 [Acidobacteriota bacterium]|nr:hypothetical protein [Acidobacteriota bacterium]